MSKFFELFGGRKNFMALLVFLVNIALLWFGKVSEGVYETLTIVTIGVYTGGNVLNKYVTRANVNDKGSG